MELSKVGLNILVIFSKKKLNIFLERLLFEFTRMCRTLTTWDDYIKCSPVLFFSLYVSFFFFYRKKVFLSFLLHSSRNKQKKNTYLCYSLSDKSYMMDVLNRYEGTTKVKYFKRYDFWEKKKCTSFNISYETNKSNNKIYHDYIANSQCCGLYSYGKLLKESK